MFRRHPWWHLAAAAAISTTGVNVYTHPLHTPHTLTKEGCISPDVSECSNLMLRVSQEVYCCN